MTDKAIPADWVLLEAARCSNWTSYSSIINLRNEYANPVFKTFRALCDMIAKHEQPPVDPDVEAVKRIFDRACVSLGKSQLAAAVAQYKLELAK